LAEVRVGVEIGVLLARDEQCGARKVDLTLVSADQRAQGAPRLGRVRQLG